MALAGARVGEAAVTKRDEADVRTRLLDAAAAEFTSPEYGILERVVLSRIAQRAGVAERTARRHFSAAELRQELVSHLLSIRPDVDIGHEEFEAFSAMLQDRELAVADALGAVADQLYEHNLGNDLMRAQMALWPYAENNPDIRERLIELYEYWLHGAKAGLNDMFVTHTDVFSFRTDWISVDDFIRAMTACVEGLAMQQVLYDLREADDERGAGTNQFAKPMDQGLAGKVILAVFASMIDRPGVDSVIDMFEQLEADRRPTD